MTIKIICVGKIKDNHIKAAIEEYCKRMTPYAAVKVIELAEYRLPEKPSAANISDGICKESEEFLKHISPSDYVVALCIEGKELTSEELAAKIETVTLSGKSTISFLIGSSFGLFEDLKEKAHFKLSFSKMTFPHQLMRLLLTEQIYRAFTILHHKEYHK